MHVRCRKTWKKNSIKNKCKTTQCYLNFIEKINHEINFISRTKIFIFDLNIYINSQLEFNSFNLISIFRFNRISIFRFNRILIFQFNRILIFQFNRISIFQFNSILIFSFNLISTRLFNFIYNIWTFQIIFFFRKTCFVICNIFTISWMLRFKFCFFQKSRKSRKILKI